MADLLTTPIQTAPPEATPIPGQQFQIQLPPPIHDMMQQFPNVLARLSVVETKLSLIMSHAPTKLIAAVAFLSGVGMLALLVFLWHYGAILFRF